MVKPKLNEIERKLKDLNQKLENQNTNLAAKIIAFTSIIDRLEKQLEGVNQTLKNLKLYGMVFRYFCFVLFCLIIS